MMLMTVAQCSPSGNKLLSSQAVLSQNCHSIHDISSVAESHEAEARPHPPRPTGRRSLVCTGERSPHATPRSPVRSALAGSLENNRGWAAEENNWRNTLEPLPCRATARPVSYGGLLTGQQGAARTDPPSWLQGYKASTGYARPKRGQNMDKVLHTIRWTRSWGLCRALAMLWRIES